MKINAQVSLLEKNQSKKGLACNNIKIKLKGSDINFVVVNTLRRIILTLVPSYAYDPNDIIISKNTSVYNNDYMKLRLSNIPIINLSYTKPLVKIDEPMLDRVLELEKEALTERDAKKIDSKELDEKIAKRKAELVNNLHMQIISKNKNDYDNKKNNEIVNNDSILSVTTNDKYTKFYLEGKNIDTIYPRSVLLIQLKSNEEFNASCIASFNIPLKSTIYQTCAACAYEEINDNEYDFLIESARLISEEKILYFACKIAIKKIDELYNKIIKVIGNNPDAKYEAEMIIEHENHTMGNLLTRVIQDHKDILFCGFKKDHLCVNEITIRYKTNNKEFIIILNDCVTYLKELFNHLSIQIDKL